jgi:predicted Zn finger-like uncharacterized protein
MLVTTCANCQARFRVTPQQLNTRQGQVRCGRCHGVFNGFQALERFPDDDTGGRLLAEHESRARDAAERQAAQTAENFEPSAPMPPQAPEAMAELETVDEAPPAAPPKPTVASLPPARALRSEPDLVLEPPRKRTKPLSRAWALGAALMALVLLAELAFAFRGPAAQRYPALRPALEAACTWLNCNVPWAREDGLLKLEDSELLEVPGKPTEIALGARIRNLASVAQEYPHLELTLTDNSGQPAARRVLRPTDYLGRSLAAGEVIGPGVELSLQMRLETPRLKATGYELLLFYP